jgi:hypothetical protein
VKSVGWYVGRFLILSIVIGAAWGLASGLAIGSFFNAKHIGLSASFIAKALRFLFIVFGFFVSLFMLRLAVAGFTFSAAFFLQGKSLRDSYSQGVDLLGAHWPYLIGIMTYFFLFSWVIRSVIAPLLPAGSLLALIASASTYLIWPLYWLLLLEYHKGAARSGRTALRARRSIRSPRSTSSGGSHTRSTRSTSSRTSTRRAPRKK